MQAAAPPRLSSAAGRGKVPVKEARERSKRLFQNLPEVAERRKKETEAKERVERMRAARETDKKRREAMRKAKADTSRPKAP